MTTNRSLRMRLLVLSAAWLMAVPAVYLLYDYWMRGSDRIIRDGALLRPYAFFVGLCPLVLFWAGSVVVTLGGLPAAGRGASGSRVLSLVILALGALGSLAGTAFAVPFMAVMLLALGRGDVPLGLLVLLGGLSAAGIRLLRYALRQLEAARPA